MESRGMDAGDVTEGCARQHVCEPARGLWQDMYWAQKTRAWAEIEWEWWEALWATAVKEKRKGISTPKSLLPIRARGLGLRAKGKPPYT